jgi:hypothetical protein
MNIIKNILLVSYIKNKGWRRLSFVIGLFLVGYGLSDVISNYHPINNKYNNLVEMQSDIEIKSRTHSPFWYKELACATAFIEKKGLKYIDAGSLFSFNKYEEFCNLYPQQCEILSKIKDKPIHLKCNGFDSSGTKMAYALSDILLCLVILFYLPFIMLCILKLTFKLIKWIYDGFFENKE